ncbi:hypothetical protein DAPPUDRAFT_311465 [Daphnia pulex]|uniref:Uncharacterized protein n=1 Tax=Daphnia pulex TaxID=6669 RepID=E9FWZ3_DAPPU|nr:hypothetical protein DAPPUDRAFT_311465 [Daphnia pulex]|eukprot:EFX87980.1 hypothetical protein DAPPUDRAFT_311465 [Daphnia pulex]
MSKHLVINKKHYAHFAPGLIISALVSGSWHNLAVWNISWFGKPVFIPACAPNGFTKNLQRELAKYCSISKKTGITCTYLC